MILDGLLYEKCIYLPFSGPVPCEHEINIRQLPVKVYHTNHHTLKFSGQGVVASPSMAFEWDLGTEKVVTKQIQIRCGLELHASTGLL